MSTALGALTVRLQADTKQLNDGFKDAAKVIRDFEKACKDQQKVLQTLEKEAAKAGGAMAHVFSGKGIKDHNREVTAKAIKGFQDLKKAAEDANKAQSGGGKGGGFSPIRGIATELNSFLSLVQRAVALVGVLFDSMENAARVSTAEKFFVNAGKNLEDFRQSTMGLVSDADLIKKSNLAETMGLTSDQFKQLAQVAQASAAKTGQSYEHMLDSIIVGTARESRLLLDNLGIIVDVTKARTDYVQSLRESNQLGDLASESNEKLAEKLTDAAQKAAFMHAVMQAGKPVLEQYEKAGEGAAEQFDKFKATIDNLKVAIGKGLLGALEGIIPILTHVANTLADLIEDHQLLNALTGGSLTVNQDRTESRMDPHAETKQRQIALMKEMDSRGVSLGQMLGTEMGPSGPGIGWSQEGMGPLTEEMDRTAQHAQYLADDLEVMTQQFREMNAVTKMFAVPEVKEAGPNPFKAPEPEEESGGGRAQAFRDPGLMWKELLLKGFAEFDKQTEASQNAMLAEEEARRTNTDALAANTGRAYEEKQVRQDNIDAIAEEAAKRRKALDEGIAEVVGLGGKALAGDASGFLEELATIIGTAVGGGATGAAIGEILGPLLAALEPVGKLFEAISLGASEMIERGFGPILDTLAPLNDALFALFVALGHLIGSAMRPFITVMTFVVGGLAFLVDVVTFLAIIISPLVEGLMALASVVVGLIGPIASFFGIFIDQGDSDILGNFMLTVEALGNVMLDAAIWINNAVVGIIRGIGEWLATTIGDDFGFSDFGEELSREDFELNTEATNDNTDSTRENTRAVRDLAREFRNLPQGYKVNYAIYESTAAVGRSPGSISAAPGVPQNYRDTYRERT